MGSILGAVIGGVGSIIGGNQAAKAQKAAAQQAMTGYNYLSSNPLIGQLQTNAASAANGEAGTTGAINSLLTSNTTDSPAFKNYLNSTGYNFQLQQGSNAITGNAAAKGLLNSGATARALQGYGQNLASTTFNNYLSQLGGLANLQGSQVGQGLTAAQAVGAAGTAGGANAAGQTAAAGQSRANATGNVFGIGANLASTYIPNFFGTPAEAPH